LSLVLLLLLFCPLAQSCRLKNYERDERVIISVIICSCYYYYC